MTETIRTQSRTVADDQIALWLQEYARRRSSATSTARRDAIPMEELKSRIARHYTGLVESVARRFASSGEPMDDLVQEGFLGLLTALDRFDHRKNVKFSTYATHFIAGTINHCLRDRGKVIKEPAWLQELRTKINRTADSLSQTLGRDAHPAEIAQVLNLTEEAVEEVLTTRQVFHVAAFQNNDDDRDMIGLIDPEKIRSDRYVTLQLPIEDRIVLENSVQHLKSLEQHVLHEFFYADLNQTEIARKLDISCNYVSHIIRTSTKKLRRIMGEAEIVDKQRNAEETIMDSTSGLYVTSHIKSRLDEELSRAVRSARPLAVLIIEIEGIPTLAGRSRDDIWGQCGAAVRRSIRRMDIAGRYEGNSILVILPNTGSQATIVASRLVDLIIATGLTCGESLMPRIGAAYFPAQGRHVTDLVQIARDEIALVAPPLPVKATEEMAPKRAVKSRRIAAEPAGTLTGASVH